MWYQVERTGWDHPTEKRGLLTEMTRRGLETQVFRLGNWTPSHSVIISYRDPGHKKVGTQLIRGSLHLYANGPVRTSWNCRFADPVPGSSFSRGLFTDNRRWSYTFKTVKGWEYRYRYKIEESCRPCFVVRNSRTRNHLSSVPRTPVSSPGPCSNLFTVSSRFDGFWVLVGGGRGAFRRSTTFVFPDHPFRHTFTLRGSRLLHFVVQEIGRV